MFREVDWSCQGYLQEGCAGQLYTFDRYDKGGDQSGKVENVRFVAGDGLTSLMCSFDLKLFSWGPPLTLKA